MRSIVSAIAPLVAGPVLFLLVLRAGPAPAPLARTELPREAYVAEHCTWHCHDHGCPHRARLPAALTHDDRLFGDVVRALYRAGRALAPGDPLLGYGIANLAVFCVFWPGLLYALWLGGLRARAERLRARA